MLCMLNGLNLMKICRLFSLYLHLNVEYVQVEMFL